MDYSLDKYLKNKKLQIPKGYFENLSHEVWQRIVAEDKRRMMIRRRWMSGISVAASVLLLLCIGFFIRQSQHGEEGEPSAVVLKKMPAQIVPTPAATPVFASSEKPNTLNMNTTLAMAKPIRPKAPAQTKQATATNIDTDLPGDYSELAIGDFEETDLNGIDYDILDFYADDCDSFDFWE